eukprot:TRINITY_DN108260_c0_g1_i1.p1 TRINITY_DN108260_c0_g1~~TRINITY_DN108260_c0_g1_i1.p1  ORF type:complete len:609 (+),score=111.58 TRINITY_DN108260_c0_g1_i1:95-1921(+)
MKAISSSLTCLLVAFLVDATKILVHRDLLGTEAEDDWCEGNVFPFPDKTYDETGLTKGQNLFGADLTNLRTVLAADVNWGLDITWEFKAKVETSGYDKNLSFGFSGGKGYLLFDVDGESGGGNISVQDQVKAKADSMAIEYRGDFGLHDPVLFSRVCLRASFCSRFTGCTPSYEWRTKQNGTGSTMSECCELKSCKNELSDGCSPSTQWTTPSNFDTKRGDSVERCCIPILCAAQNDSICPDPDWTRRIGTGIRGSTTAECCQPQHCSDNLELCDPHYTDSRLSDVLSNGSSRLGGTNQDCCNYVQCTDFPCDHKEGMGQWTFRDPDDRNGTGFTFSQCCKAFYCKDWNGCDNSTKHERNSDSDHLRGPTYENCCHELPCSKYNCSAEWYPKANRDHLLGSTDSDCCDQRRCTDFTCEPPDEWVEKSIMSDGQDGRQYDRLGYSNEACCVPKLCSEFNCDDLTKWRNDPNLSADKRGSQPEKCCVPQYCADYNCTSDYDGDGIGTMYRKIKDTNVHKVMGSTDEECCLPQYCSQYQTDYPTKWKKKHNDGVRLGSTDEECYDPIFCSTFTGRCPDDKKIKQDAAQIQGSTVDECCASPDYFAIRQLHS